MADWKQFKEWGSKYDSEGNSYQTWLKTRASGRVTRARVKKWDVKKKKSNIVPDVKVDAGYSNKKLVWKKKGRARKVKDIKGKLFSRLRKTEKALKLQDTRSQAQAQAQEEDIHAGSDAQDASTAYKENFGFDPIPALTPDKISELQDKPKLTEYLGQLGYSDKQIQDIYTDKPPPFFQIDPTKVEMAEEDLQADKEKDVYALKKQFSPAFLKAKSTAASGLLLGEEEEKMEDVREDLVEGQQEAFEERQRGFEKDIYGLQSEAGDEFKSWMENTLAAVSPEDSLLAAAN